MNSENAVQLPLRIFLVALLAVVIQEAVVSQITILGANADITPLVVMSIGLLCGSLPGAIVGFCMGLFVDTVQFQTLGITSLLFIVIGYWAGRLKELRAPSHGLVPLALGAAATAVAGVGMAVIQFLLGVDAPVSLLLVQQIVMTILINTLIALPVYEIVRRVIYPALPGDPRRRRRRDRRYSAELGSRSPLQQPSRRLTPRSGR